MTTLKVHSGDVPAAGRLGHRFRVQAGTGLLTAGRYPGNLANAPGPANLYSWQRHRKAAQRQRKAEVVNSVAKRTLLSTAISMAPFTFVLLEEPAITLTASTKTSRHATPRTSRAAPDR